MKKRNEIILGIFMVIVGIVFLTSNLARSQVYQVGNLGGGLNLFDDSVNIASNEALVMTNLVLNMRNVPSSRPGFSVLNSTVINASEKINTIYIYEPYSGTQRMVIATNGGVYIMPSLADPGVVDWDALKMGWDGDSIAIANDYAYDLGPNDWWYTKLGEEDTIIVNSTKYEIVVHNRADTVAYLDYTGATDTVADYTVYVTIRSNYPVTFIQQGDKLYICPSRSMTLIYDDTSYVFMALIDSGLVTDTTQLTDSTSYNRGKVHASISSFREFKFDSLASAICDSDWVGKYFTLHMRNERSGGDYIAKWTGIIEMMRQTPTGWQMWTATGFERNQRPFDYWNNYEVKAPLANCVADSGYAIEDTNKNWMDQDYGKEYLQDFYAINGDNGYSQTTKPNPSMIRRIYCNETNTFSIPWQDTMTYNADDRYYIFTRIPRILNSIDSAYKEFPRFEQVFFYNNQLFGFGWDKIGYDVVTELNYNRIWYSAIGESRDLGIMSRYIKPFYNFDIDLSENVSRMFRLRGRAYIAASNSIWSFTGIPALGDNVGDLYYEEIISNNGIPDIDNWAKATEEYGYFANYDGIFRFNGIRATNVSYDIDRAVKQYSGSECVLVYQSDRLYVSYPDSGVTFIYREPLDKWYGPFDFGMTCAYAPVDTDIIYFGNPDYPGHVFFYPNGLNYDVAPNNDTLAIAWAYESGWQSLTDGPWNSKKLLTGYFPANTSDTFSVDIFADFATVTADTFTWYPGGSSAHRFDNLSSTGDYFKFKIYGTTMQGVVIRPYRIDWQEADMREGN